MEASDEGILYIAFGQKYHDEARRSLRSLRKVSNLPTVVITERSWAEEPLPDHFIVRPPLKSTRAKPLYLYEATPFEKTLFLGTDTVIGRDVVPAFGLLKHYDIGVRFGGPPVHEGDGL